MNYVMRDGRRIEVETIEAPARKRRQADFVMLPRRWGVKAARAIKSPKAIVLIELLHSVWRAKSDTVTFSNDRLKGEGVSRQTKHRALREWEAAGLICVERQRGRAPVVTILR